MAKSLFITSMEAQSGKTPVALGFMEQLSGRLRSVSVFRPVIAEGSGPDRLIALMTDLYHLRFPAEDLYGVTYDAARTLLSAGKYDSCTAASSKSTRLSRAGATLSSA